LKVEKLQFFPPNYEKFPCLALAQQVIKTGGTAMAVLNVANEVSVEAFLNQRIPFTAIAEINQQVMQQANICVVENIQQLIELDVEVRSVAHQILKNR